MPSTKIYAPILRPVTIDDNPANATTTLGDIQAWVGSAATTFETAPAANVAYGLCLSNRFSIDNGDPLLPTGHFQAEKIWNSVWNDYADFQLLNDDYIPGKCYYDTADGAKICNERCQLSVIGIGSDTFAQVVGKRRDQKQLPIAVAGWVLAYVDKEYPCGTPLTNDENGNLTEITLEEKRDFPERIVGIYKRKEHDKEFGSESSKIQVNNRHWVKVK